MAHPDQKLTLREMEVLNAISDGLSTKAAARLLGVTVKTVENHRRVCLPNLASTARPSSF
jgi:DNA-binding NarL/FixJ family response regulator